MIVTRQMDRIIMLVLYANQDNNDNQLIQYRIIAPCWAFMDGIRRFQFESVELGDLRQPLIRRAFITIFCQTTQVNFDQTKTFLAFISRKSALSWPLTFAKMASFAGSIDFTSRKFIPGNA